MATTTSPKSGGSKKKQKQQEQQQIPLVEQARATLKRLEEKDPGLGQQLERARGYAVFPSVGKASLVVGGSYGRGAVFERGNKLIGYATISQLTLGVQLGGDTFSEVVLLQTPEALERFKSGHKAFAANASTVLVKAGAAATSNFKGVKTLAYSRGGLLLELAIGGQKFTFRPLDGQGNKGQTGGGNQGGAKGASQGGSDASGGAEDQGAVGMIGRTVGGVREAASKVTGLVKEHPVLAGVAATGLAAGVAVWAIRAVLNAQQAAGAQGAGGEEEADDQADDELQDQDEAGEDDGQDYADDEDAQDDEDAGEEDEPDAKFLRRGRSRA